MAPTLNIVDEPQFIPSYVPSALNVRQVFRPDSPGRRVGIQFLLQEPDFGFKMIRDFSTEVLEAISGAIGAGASGNIIKAIADLLNKIEAIAAKSRKRAELVIKWKFEKSKDAPDIVVQVDRTVALDVDADRPDWHLHLNSRFDTDFLPTWSTGNENGEVRKEVPTFRYYMSQTNVIVEDTLDLVGHLDGYADRMKQFLDEIKNTLERIRIAVTTTQPSAGASSIFIEELTKLLGFVGDFWKDTSLDVRIKFFSYELEIVSSDTVRIWLSDIDKAIPNIESAINGIPNIIIGGYPVTKPHIDSLKSVLAHLRQEREKLAPFAKSE